MVEVPESVTICVTSCGRLDLLQKTLASFNQFNRGGKFILSEDSADPEIIKQVRNLFPDIVVLHDEARTGLMKSIDRIYSKVETDFIFHLEDDWEFDGPVDWLSAIALLQARPEVANINVRKFEEIKPKWRSKSDPLPFEGVDYQLMRLSSHPEFFAWSPNPGLIRTDLYRTYAPFSRFMPDQLSGIIKQDGGRMAFQTPGCAGHIGQGRNVVDPTMTARPRSKIAKFFRKIRKDLYYAGFFRKPF
jgi:hypothetical protein